MTGADSDKRYGKQMNKHKKRFLFAVILLLVASLALAYSIRDRETKMLDAATRAGIGGTYVTLSNGVVHYELSGEQKTNNVGQETVVMVHGFSSPSYVFDPTFDYLRQHDFRVLRFDLFGRGFSDRISGSDYGIELYVEQLKGLLDALDIQQPVHLIGLSMGGAIVTHFVNKYPERVEKIALFAPLFETPERPEVALVKAPYLGEYLGKIILVPRFIQGASETVYDTASFQDWEEKFSPQTEYEGFSLALVQTARFLAGKSFQKEYQKLGSLNKPLQLIWGRQDKVIPFKDHEKVLAAVPSTEFHAINNAGHLPHYEQADLVNPLLLSFLKSPAETP